MRCRLIEGTTENLKDVCEQLGLRSKMQKSDVVSIVQGVLDDIKENGDEAVLKYTKKFDGADLTPASMRVTQEEIDSAIGEIEPDLLRIIKKAAENIRTFHEKQREEGFMMDTAKGSKIG
ncbi:MAG: histidinol dehydrogenase, partial [Clostridiales bacterium]|nr:histidinol dehydrogenase [Clostridiales bacterium]